MQYKELVDIIMPNEPFRPHGDLKEIQSLIKDLVNESSIDIYGELLRLAIQFTQLMARQPYDNAKHVILPLNMSKEYPIGQYHYQVSDNPASTSLLVETLTLTHPLYIPKSYQHLKDDWDTLRVILRIWGIQDTIRIKELMGWLNSELGNWHLSAYYHKQSTTIVSAKHISIVPFDLIQISW